MSLEMGRDLLMFFVFLQGLIDLAKNPSEFCMSAIFTLTASLNDGAVICECSPLGTVGGAEANCQVY